MIISGVYQYYLRKKWRFQFTDDTLLIKYGVLERVSKAILLRKVQGVQIKQSPYQFKNALSTILLHTASGDIKIPYIPLETAWDIKNYILFKVEASKYKWM
jgi:putative membrane protein